MRKQEDGNNALEKWCADNIAVLVEFGLNLTPAAHGLGNSIRNSVSLTQMAQLKQLN